MLDPGQEVLSQGPEFLRTVFDAAADLEHWSGPGDKPTTWPRCPKHEGWPLKYLISSHGNPLGSSGNMPAQKSLGTVEKIV